VRFCASITPSSSWRMTCSSTPSGAKSACFMLVSAHA